MPEAGAARIDYTITTKLDLRLRLDLVKGLVLVLLSSLCLLSRSYYTVMLQDERRLPEDKRRENRAYDRKNVVYLKCCGKSNGLDILFHRKFLRNSL